MNLEACPITITEANNFVAEHHRHSKKTQGGRFAIGAIYDGQLVAVAIVARPVARRADDRYTAEIRRLCACPDAPKNACSFLYARCWRIWQQMGGTRMITYTLQCESGSSLRGAGWKITGENKAQTWDVPNRSREPQDVYYQDKFRWEPST
tara:strand:+ start:10215 stop:10667 length:453 start_codon:yes stop_codon:yes gene_type:complete